MLPDHYHFFFIINSQNRNCSGVFNYFPEKFFAPMNPDTVFTNIDYSSPVKVAAG
jgi:hypothetical protein